MLFCPTCANLLLIEKTHHSNFRFFWKTCPYVFVVTQPFEKTMVLPGRKEVDDVLGGKEAWENVDQITVEGGCRKCSNKKAYFMMK